MLRHLLLPTVLVALLVSGCKKDEADPPTPLPTPTPMLRVNHVVDGEPLVYDTLRYTNEAGALYSVTRVEYYLSELVLIGTGGTPNDTLHGPWYVNAAGETNFDLSRLRAGTYSGATMLLGLPPALNTTG
ncbi:MAG: MbnP family protein, partial [Flavobacteriales bacterium]